MATVVNRMMEGSMQFKLVFLLLNALLFAAASDENAACDKWAAIASNLTGSGRYQNCTSASPPKCTRLDCTGAVRFSHFRLPGAPNIPIELDYCFGAELLSCTEPISLDFYLQLPDVNFKKAFRVSEDKNIDLSDVKFPLGPAGTASPQLDFRFERRADGKINMSVISKVKVTNKVLGSFFVDELQRTLIDREVIHAQPCPSGTKQSTSSEPDPEFMPDSCKAPKYKPVSTVAPPMGVTASPTYKKTCDIFEPSCSTGEICDSSLSPPKCVCSADRVLSQRGEACVSQDRLRKFCRAHDDCAVNEACTGRDGDFTFCDCEPGTEYSTVRLMCVRPQPGKSHHEAAPGTKTVAPPSAPVTAVPHVQTDTPGKEPEKPKPSNSASSTKVPIIVGGAVGGFVLLTAVVVANVYLFRRYKRRRQGGAGSGIISESDAPLLGDDDDVNMIM